MNARGLARSGPPSVLIATAAKYNRLRLVKQHYDPDNFFRLNQNIPPA
jgi:hypothetical protein